MPSSKTTWFCDKCGQPFSTELQAADCEGSHYTIGEIVGIKYEAKKKCPSLIQLQVNVGDDIKEVTFRVVEDSWGVK
ncbi:hypothetical protein [Paenibacillus polymyxa]|uniref:hypothetical protein n=1 Tax=Paenibacillus polymyxa TaxID=1406 RepID=UPI00058A03B4|nr:hypothetical protein [Paenibacillus polymyxa]AJE54285.1 hypothetical protein RE92_25195 [Paenibacillus polymyxa]